MKRSAGSPSLYQTMPQAALKTRDKPKPRKHLDPDSPWAGRRRPRQQNALKREAVILAAARAFRERGYHNTSLDNLAGSLKVTKPTLYIYVPGKEAMLFECFKAGLAQIQATLDQCEIAGGPARERLFAFIRGYAAAIVGDFGWCMLRAEDQHLGTSMSRKIKLLKAGIDRRMRALIDAGVADGSIRDCDTRMTAFALAGALNWMGHWYREDASLNATEIADRFIDVFNRGLRGRD
jgi:AcrR family transcriptional regulator